MLIIASKIVEILHSLTTYSWNALHNNSVRLLHTRSVQLLPYFGCLLLLLAAFSMRNFTEWAILCISKMYYLHSYTILLWHLPRLTISTYLAKWATFTTGRKLYHPLNAVFCGVKLMWLPPSLSPYSISIVWTSCNCYTFSSYNVKLDGSSFIEVPAQNPN